MRIKSQSKNSHGAKAAIEDQKFREILEKELAKRGKHSGKNTQDSLANDVGITASYLSEILDGKKSGQRQAMKALIKLGHIDKIISSYNENGDFTNPYPILTNNKTLCDDLEFILKSGDNAAITALEYLVKGVKLSVIDGSEQVKLLRRLAEGQEKLIATVESLQENEVKEKDAAITS